MLSIRLHNPRTPRSQLSIMLAKRKMGGFPLLERGARTWENKFALSENYAAFIGMENSTDEGKKDPLSLLFKWSGSETVFPR